MPKITAVTLLLCWYGFSCYGQDYVVDINQSGVIHRANHNFYVERVVDARLEKANVGTVQTGALNSRKVAVLKGPLPQELMDFFNRNRSPDTSQHPVIVKVLKFRIREQTRSLSESAYAEVLLHFLRERNPGEYQCLYAASARTEHRGMEVTVRHGENLATALQNCLDQFAARDFTALLAKAPVIYPDQLETGLVTPADTFSFSVLRDSVYRPGAYQDFGEFRDNTPGVVRSIFVERTPRTNRTWRGTDEIRPHVFEVNGQKRPLRKVWGFSDGERAYVNFRGRYYPLERAGNVFTFYGHVPSGYAYAVINTGSVAGVIGGLVGSLVGGVLSAAATENSQAEYVLDILTGQVSDLDNYVYRSTRPARIVIYYRRDKKQAAAPVQLVLRDRTDTLFTELAPDSFAELTWKDLRSNLSIRTRQGLPEATLVPGKDQINYFEYVAPGKRAATAVIRPVTEKEATFYLKQIRYAREIAERRSQRNR